MTGFATGMVAGALWLIFFVGLGLAARKSPGHPFKSISSYRSSTRRLQRAEQAPRSQSQAPAARQAAPQVAAPQPQRHLRPVPDHFDWDSAPGATAQHQAAPAIASQTLPLAVNGEFKPTLTPVSADGPLASNSMYSFGKPDSSAGRGAPPAAQPQASARAGDAKSSQPKKSILGGLKGRKNQTASTAASMPSPKTPKAKGLGVLSKLIPKAEAPVPTPNHTPPPSMPKPNPNARRFTAPYNYVAPTAGSPSSAASATAPKGSPHTGWNPSSSFRPAMPGVPTPPAQNLRASAGTSEPAKGYTPPSAIHPSTSPYAYRPEESEPHSATSAGPSARPSTTAPGAKEAGQGTPDLSIFGAKVPLVKQDPAQSPAEDRAEIEPTQQMPEISKAFEAAEQAVDVSYETDPEVSPDEPADPVLPNTIEPWMFEPQPSTGSPDSHASHDNGREAGSDSIAWDELAPRMRSDRPARPLYRFEDPTVKDEPISPIEQQPSGEQPQLRFEDPQLRFDDLTARYAITGPSEATPVDEQPQEPQAMHWRYEAEAYESESRLFGDQSLVDWAAVEDTDPRAGNDPTDREDQKERKRVLQWQSGGDQVVAAERRASILKNTSANAKVRAADEAMIVEDGLVYVLVDDEGQPVLT